MTSIVRPPTAPRAAVVPLRSASKAILDAWKVLRKRWVWVVTLAVSTIVATAFYTAGQKRIYRSSCILQIDPKPIKPLGEVQAVVEVGSGSFFANNEYYRTQFQIIQSRVVAEDTVQRLGLQQDAAFLLGLGPKEQVPATGVPAGASIERVAQRLRGQLSVEPIRESRLVTISYSDPNPERARQILATLVSVYVDRNIDTALDSTNTAAEWLRGQVDNLKQELEGNELALNEYKKDNRILSVSLDDQNNMLRQEMQQLSQALTAVRVRRTEVAAQAEEIASLGQARGSAGMPVSALLTVSSLKNLRDMLDAAVSERDALIGSGRGEMHPLVASASARVRAAEDAVQQEIQNIQSAAQRELAVVDHQIQSLSVLFEQAQQRALSLGGLEIDYRRLERGKTNTEKLYSLVIEKSKQTDLTRMLRFNNITVIDPPLVPHAPVSPRVPLNMAAGLLGGLALGLLCAFGREMFDQSIKSQADVEELGITYLGTLPRLTGSQPSAYGTKSRKKSRSKPRAHPDLQSPELIVHEDPTSAVSESARGIRTNLAFMSPDNPYRTLLVTSGGPAEGKTTVACSLAIAMAQAGHRVVLMDCDLRRPRLHKVFNLLNDRGVTTALVERDSLSKDIQSTVVPNLSVLTSGPNNPSPAESLGSKSFQSLLADLSSSYDRVVIDSPPVGAVTDGVVLSTRVDATLLVVRALRSARDMVRQAQRSLQDVRANLAGAVLNAADQKRSAYPYYRYYGRRESEAPPPPARDT
ncbi:MAG: polysaccharide biosynthesis tyrosine autokinase [Deltaproteobacteria bacterium]